MTYPLPAGDPEALRAAARAVSRAASALDGSGRGTTAAALAVAPAWDGTASVLFLTRAGELSRGGTASAAAAAPVATALSAYADAVDRARAAVRQLTDELADAHARARAQSASLQATGAGPDPAGWLPSVQAELDQRYARVRDDLADAARRLERTLQACDPLAAVPPWLRAGVQAGLAAKKGWGLLQKTGQLGEWAQSSVATALAAPGLLRGLTGEGEFDAEAWARTVLAMRRGEAARDAFVLGRTPTGALAGVRTVLGRVALPLTVLNGTEDAWTGGGYGGARGGMTRALGAAGALGGGALVFGEGGLTLVALGPVGAPVAAGAVLVYGAWSLGNLVADHWDGITSFASAAGSDVVGGAEALGRHLGDGAEHVASDALQGVEDAAGTVAHTLLHPSSLVPHVSIF